MLTAPEHFHTKSSLRDMLGKDIKEATISSHVRKLREKFTTTVGAGKEIIVSKYGLGYRLWNRQDMAQF